MTFYPYHVHFCVQYCIDNKFCILFHYFSYPLAVPAAIRYLAVVEVTVNVTVTVTVTQGAGALSQ